MKKLGIIVILMVVSTCIFGQIKTSGIFETGYESRRTMVFPADTMYKVYGVLPYYDLQAFYGKLYMSATYKGFEAYTSNKTWFNKDQSIYFDPLQSEFRIGANYTKGSFKLGYEHMCNHSIEGKRFSDFYDRIYVRVKLF